MAYLGKTPSQAVRSRYYFTATGGETSLSGADDNSKTLVFADGNYVDVTLNGVTLVAGTDYNTTTSNTIGGLTALTASDVVEVVVYDTFSVFSGNVNSDFTVGGSITTDGLTTTGNINFGDNDKAIFGAGSDLQIYHNAGTSFITESGSSNLKIGGENLYLQNTAHNENYLAAIANQGVTIYYNNSEKLATTSTGIDVTGTVTADGLTVSSGATFDGGDTTVDFSLGTGRFTTVNSFVFTVDDDSNSADQAVYFRSNAGQEVATFKENGDISFYEDTGTTPKFFWDASAESLGIGTGSPSGGAVGGKVVHVQNSGGTASMRVDRSDAAVSGTLSMTSGNGSNSLFGTGTKPLAFFTNSTERMRIDSSGNVGIGVTSISNQGQLYIGASGTSTNAQIGLSPTNSSGGQNPLSQIGASADGTYGSTLYFNTRSTGGTVAEAMRIDSSGNVGIGDISPDRKLHVNSGTTNVVAKFESTDSTAAIEFTDSAGSAEIGNSGNDLVLFPAGTERMRIDSSGNLMVGASSFSPSNTDGAYLSSSGRLMGTISGDAPLYANRRTSTGGIAEWAYNGTVVGTVSTNGSSTSYNTSSDHRLKENAVDLTGAITRVKSLQPKRFNFIADDSTTVDGFMAHEAATVVPEAVTGTHNEVDADGNPVYQGIDQSKLVPLLTAALQEAITKIETLETKVTALENA